MQQIIDVPEFDRRQWPKRDMATHQNNSLHIIEANSLQAKNRIKTDKGVNTHYCYN